MERNNIALDATKKAGILSCFSVASNLKLFFHKFLTVLFLLFIFNLILRPLNITGRISNPSKHIACSPVFRLCRLFFCTNFL